jgi:hypothetical protein
MAGRNSTAKQYRYLISLITKIQFLTASTHPVVFMISGSRLTLLPLIKAWLPPIVLTWMESHVL